MYEDAADVKAAVKAQRLQCSVTPLQLGTQPVVHEGSSSTSTTPRAKGKAPAGAPASDPKTAPGARKILTERV